MDGSTEGARVLLWIATALPALGVSAAFGSISFSLRGRAAPKGLPRRAEVLLFVVSLVAPILLLPVLWTSISGYFGAGGSAGFYPWGWLLPVSALVLAVCYRRRSGKGRRFRTALVLAALSCGLYAAPVFLYGYAAWGL